MGIRKYKPTTPGRRGSSVADFVEITRTEPEKSLVRPLAKSGGRNSTGRVTTRHKGGGHKRAYRVIDFRRHDTTAKHLPDLDRQKYALKKAELIKAKVEQAQADEQLNAFFWQCFEDDDEDEGNEP